MAKSIEEVIPRLMTDSSTKDGKAETMMDYIISWTLRSAEDKYKETRPILNKNAKKILLYLIGYQKESDIEIIEVQTWKQSSQIDLWGEIRLKRNGQEELHAILIESKYYTGLHNATDIDGEKRNQLIVYKKKFDNYYNAQNENWIRHYNLITCIEREEPDKFTRYEIAKEFGFDIFTFYEIVNIGLEETESDIFNEFWLCW